MMGRAYIGVDVGTGSARAGVFNAHGERLGQAVREITTWRPAPDFVEQSSADIWQAVIACVQAARQQAGIAAEEIAGIGFDATCSLVAIDAEGQPVTVSPSGKANQNVIVWMDHRAKPIAGRINQGDHEVLRYVGGKISPEMEIPKLVWLKENLPASWDRAAHFFDLPDFLTWRATGDLTRSLCSTVCKWNYRGHEDEGWDAEFLTAVGLEACVADGFAKIGQRVAAMGTPLGQGLHPQAAAELGLVTGTAVSVSIIDAHAGGLGMIGAAIDGKPPTPESFNRRLALIGGTSSCHLAVSPQPRFIDGIWGPYYSAMLPAWWLTEGGQSATGSLIDLIVKEHGASAEAARLADHAGCSVYEWLNRRLADLAGGQPIASLTETLHVCPYFHGNRSPRANPDLRGMISGLRLQNGLDDLALLYLATLQAIALGTRHIIAAMNAQGYAIDTLIVCGGGTKNPLFLQQHADATQCRLVLPREPEAVLLGGAMMGATAAGDFASLPAAMAAMSAAGQLIEPAAAQAGYFASKYQVFLQMHDDQLRYQALMAAGRRQEADPAASSLD